MREWNGRGSSLVLWVGLRLGRTAGRACQVSQVLSHLAAASPSPTVPRLVRSASVGPLVMESMFGKGVGSRSPRPELFHGVPCSWRKDLGALKPPRWWGLLNGCLWAVCSSNEDPREGSRPSDIQTVRFLTEVVSFERLHPCPAGLAPSFRTLFPAHWQDTV